MAAVTGLVGAPRYESLVVRVEDQADHPHVLHRMCLARMYIIAVCITPIPNFDLPNFDVKETPYSCQTKPPRS